jgi:hypothetical protein
MPPKNSKSDLKELAAKAAIERAAGGAERGAGGARGARGAARGAARGGVDEDEDDLGAALTNINRVQDKLHYLNKYMNTLGIHKITDMKHDSLGSVDGTFPHFRFFIPKILQTEDKYVPLFGTIENIAFPGISDDNFLRKHVIIRETKSQEKIPFTDLNTFAMAIRDNDEKNLRIEICYDTANTIDELNPIYVYPTIRKISYHTSPPPSAIDFLTTLDIKGESILNVDFQYKLWELLKKGNIVSGTEIFLKKTSENENDPAGKYNMKDKIFTKKDYV